MTKKMLLTVAVFALLALPLAAQDYCGVYEVDGSPQQSNGTLSVYATAYSDCYNPSTSINLTVTAPNGAHNSGSGSGAAYASAGASVSVANQTGYGSYSGSGDTSDTCWDWGYSGGSYSFGPTQVRLNDPTPVITGIDNSTWPAGATTPIHITGNWFGTNPTLSISDGSITFNISSSNNTNVWASVSVPVSTSTENVNLSVVSRGFNGQGFQSAGGNPAGSQSASISVPAIPAPAPVVKFNGDAITGTISVVVGQQIPLTTSVTLPSGLAITSQAWSVPGTVVGGLVGYTPPGGDSGYSFYPSFTSPSITFYWVDPSTSSRQVTYSYCMNNNECSPAASANFAVSGPTCTGDCITAVRGKLPSSIPVPVAYMTWQFSGDATFDSGTSTWTYSGTSGNGVVQPTSSYPIWSNRLVGGNNCPQ